MVTTTIRFPDGLYQHVSDYAEVNDLSKNQVIKMAVREFLERKGVHVYRETDQGELASEKN